MKQAIASIKKAIVKTYGKPANPSWTKICAAVDARMARLHEVHVPEAAGAVADRPPVVSDAAPEFVKRVTALMMAEAKAIRCRSASLPADGTYPVGTTKWEKRNIAQEIPVWDENICIQCGKCVLVCPHSVIRGKVYEPAALADAPGNVQVHGGGGGRAVRTKKYSLPGCARGLHRLPALR